MYVSLKILLPIVFILLLTTQFVSAQTAVLDADPDFDNYSADPAGPWQTFKIGNTAPAVWHSPKGGEGWPSGPALMLTGKVPFDGGVYQTVNVTPGKGYHFEVAWAAVRYSGGVVSSDLGKTGRLAGFDPYGGTNAAASSIQWSPELRDARHFQTPEMQLDQYARSSKITIFIRAKNDYSDGLVEVYFDHAVLSENTSMGTITIAPTAAAIPATVTRTAPTATRQRVAQASSATSTPPPTVTLEPTTTDTPRPVPSRTPRTTATPEETSDASGSPGITVILLALGGLGMGAVALLGFGFVIFRLLGRR